MIGDVRKPHRYHRHSMIRLRFLHAFSTIALLVAPLRADLAPALPPPKPLAIGELPKDAKLALDEDWSSGQIDEKRWYMPRHRWGDPANHGVTRDNVRLERDTVAGKEKHVLVIQANGDQYDGPVVGAGGRKKRVGGICVTREFFASGRYEVVMKVGSDKPTPGGPAEPNHPKGAVPAIWTYAYRAVKVPPEKMREFVADQPLYNPLMPRYGTSINEYWSELDFPEIGKAGVFDRVMYNTFLQNMHEPKVYDVGNAMDGKYHTYTTEWHTELKPMNGVTDAQVRQAGDLYWIADKSIPFHTYFGSPLKRLGPDRYALYAGRHVDHWIDGKKVAANDKWVPAMAAQLTLGIWLPDWAGPAAWKESTVSFASVKIWQFNEPGDVRSVLTQSIWDRFDAKGKELPEPKK